MRARVSEVTLGSARSTSLASRVAWSTSLLSVVIIRASGHPFAEAARILAMVEAIDAREVVDVSAGVTTMTKSGPYLNRNARVTNSQREVKLAASLMPSGMLVLTLKSSSRGIGPGATYALSTA